MDLAKASVSSVKEIQASAQDVKAIFSGVFH